MPISLFMCVPLQEPKRPHLSTEIVDSSTVMLIWQTTALLIRCRNSEPALAIYAMATTRYHPSIAEFIACPIKPVFH